MQPSPLFADCALYRCPAPTSHKRRTKPRGLDTAYEATGQVYKLGARYYNQTTGTFTQPDPSGHEANAYLYAQGDPANVIDPTGLSDLFDNVFAGVGLVLGVAALGVFFRPEAAGVSLGAGLAAAVGFDVSVGVAVKTYACDIEECG